MAEAKKLNWRMDAGDGTGPPWIADSTFAPGTVYSARNQDEREKCQAMEDKLGGEVAPLKKAKG